MSLTRKTSILILFITIAFSGQAQKEIEDSFFNHLRNGALILSDGNIIEGAQETQDFVTNFHTENGKESIYNKTFSIEVNPILDYEIGEIRAGSSSFDVMLLKRKDDPSGAKIEFLVIYKNKNPSSEFSRIDKKRGEWMELCNAHKANQLVEELYTANAFYYNRGRLLKGTKALSAEYSYMNASGYSLKLTPKHVEFVTSDIAYEIGRCSGSYPYPYMLLWEKQTNGDWKVLMDSNY